MIWYDQQIVFGLSTFQPIRPAALSILSEALGKSDIIIIFLLSVTFGSSTLRRGQLEIEQNSCTHTSFTPLEPHDPLYSHSWPDWSIASGTPDKCATVSASTSCCCYPRCFDVSNGSRGSRCLDDGLAELLSSLHAVVGVVPKWWRNLSSPDEENPGNKKSEKTRADFS